MVSKNGDAHTTTAMIFRGKFCYSLELVISDSYGFTMAHVVR